MFEIRPDRVGLRHRGYRIDDLPRLQHLKLSDSSSFSSASSDDSSTGGDYESYQTYPRGLDEDKSVFRNSLLLLCMILLCCVCLPMQIRFLSQNTDQLRQLLDESSNAVQENFDGLVFVVMGESIAANPVLRWSVHSAVEVGGWQGKVYIVTDQTEETIRATLFLIESHPRGLQPENLVVIQEANTEVPLSSYQAKLVKSNLMAHLPSHLENVLYIDSDIQIGLPLNPFLQTVQETWDQSPGMTMGLFEDGKAFTAGFCHECELWNSGVMSLRRGKSEECMEQWNKNLAQFAGNDQTALDRVVANGHCQGIRTLPREHVRMMKDVFVVLGMIGNRTFNHYTGIIRASKLNFIHYIFYSWTISKDLSDIDQPLPRPPVFYSSPSSKDLSESDRVGGS